MQEGVDCLWWNEHPEGLYKVSSWYKLLNQIEPMNTFLPWNYIWKTKIPYKVAYFTRIKISLCSRCFLYGKEAETINHLFMHCSITDQLWNIQLLTRQWDFHIYSSWTDPNENAPQDLISIEEWVTLVETIFSWYTSSVRVLTNLL